MTKRVLGIDPGLLHTGWAVVDTAGQTRKYIASGVILPNPKMEMADRLYGVTMPQRGISQAIELNVNEIEGKQEELLDGIL